MTNPLQTTPHTPLPRKVTLQYAWRIEQLIRRTSALLQHADWADPAPFILEAEKQLIEARVLAHALYTEQELKPLLTTRSHKL